MNFNYTHYKFKLTLLFLSLSLSFTCILPVPNKSDNDTDGNNFSNNFMFSYLILLNQSQNANYCPKPNQILRKNTDSPITLTVGQPYYFHYHYLDNAKPQEEVRTYTFKITKQSGTTLVYKENSNCNRSGVSFSTVTPTTTSATEENYTLSYNQNFQPSWQIQNIYSVELISGDPNITLRQD
ncbi:Hypothetical protein LBF_1193 [Leptospira biflexa serovar Patoc strain 'Patoc 1 (Ames)']|uniref:Lipoprotein n=1 Tax=Leptospira biflexa serovar Patoc (strain Patoc 1 / ATCC 23582 / Paris) TaxID=456481 RepID=B0SNS6_LEPBP|nr:hypothetical protein [Leptospira biflexa]ABZ93717.1 Hypothetical protein LBF_1193 [Leptospira biflexa serovar Patoc strain 'Patoc 1 (Ames)']ABZ97357.1 Hypothetical protein; putative signal peptide [Leptospira biflexa serovar Patoc strain 'Patoc 1 (Paris)']